MLVFAAITPHPPIIIPGIGSPKDLKLAKNTISAMEKLSQKISEAKPDTVIIISPHAAVHSDRFAIYASPHFYGNFGQFNAPSISQRFDNNLFLAEKIRKKADEAGIGAFLFGDPESDHFELDHGEMVPMYYLGKGLPNDTKVIPIAYSYLDRAQHYAFGQVMQEVADSPEFADERIAIIASGDLSHRLTPDTDNGYNNAGKDFDKQLVEFISQDKVRDIIEMDEEFIEEAGECGFRSILVLLGALEACKYQPEVLSYEGPFGVGYLVANFELK